MAETVAIALAEWGVIGWGTASTIASYAAYINFALAVTASTAYGRQQARKARAAYNDNLKDREVTIRSGVSPRRVIYGRDKVGGTLVYAQSTGSKGEYLHLVIALAAHECDAIEEVWFGDVLLPTPDSNGDIISGDFAKSTKGLAQSVALTTSAGGVATLPQAADRVVIITTPYVGSGLDATGGATLGGWSHTAGSATITGLPASTEVVVNYEYTQIDPLVRIRKHLGAPGQAADSELVAASGGKWTAAHTGTGICYLYVRLKYDQDVFGATGIPPISAVVRGRKVLDPRTSTTAWTENAALIVADWLRDATFGLRASSDQVPTTEVIAEANICDELVTVATGVTQPRYTYNGSFTSDQPPVDVLEDILSGMAGTCIWTQGRWLMRAGAYRTPSLTITADDLAGTSISIQPRASRAELINAVRITHRDPSQAWAEVQAPVVENALYTAQDGGTQLVRNITLPCASDAMRAQRMAKIELERARQAVTVRLSTSLRGYNLAPTDTVTLQLSRYGWGAGKVFEVIERTLAQDGTVGYVLRETAASVWAWSMGEATAADPAPDTALPSPYARPAELTGLAAASGTEHLVRLGDGTIVTRVRVAWDQSTDAFVAGGGRIDLRWRRVGDVDWQPAAPAQGDATSAFLDAVPDGIAIIVQARPVNAAGRAGDWQSIAHQVVGKTAAPANVQAFTVVEWPQGARAYYWDFADEPDLSGFVVRYCEASLNLPWAAMTPMFEAGRLDRSTYTQSPGDGEWIVAIKARDTSGNESVSDRRTSILLDASGFGAAVLSVDASAVGWPGTRTDCSLVDYYLVDSGSLTWDTIPTTWDAWDTWDGPSVGVISYEHTTIDLGASAARRLRASHVAFGSVTAEYQSSTDGVSYTSWSAIPSGAITFRYLRVRWTVSGALPTLYRAHLRIYN